LYRSVNRGLDFHTFDDLYLFPHINSWLHIKLFLSEEQQRISKNIDAMPGLEQEEILKLLALNPIKSATGAFPALQIFIANDQVKCMEAILRTPGFSLPQPDRLQKSLLVFMTQHNRPACLDLFLREHSNNFLTEPMPAAPLPNLNLLSNFAIENGRLESLKALLIAIRKRCLPGVFAISKIAAINQANRTPDHKEACLTLIKSIVPSNENKSTSRLS